VTAYGILSRGLLTGSRPAGQGDLRAHLPRFTGGNVTQNDIVVEELNQLAANKGVTPAQLAIAWVLAKGRRIIPVIGARTRKQLSESLAALRVKLSAADLGHIEDSVRPSDIAGTRYDSRQMAMLDSEK
jgi:aryl-alcohol dehydrogenase-like predicted oxidoreductase